MNLTFIVIYMVLRALLFKQNGIAWYKGVIPFYNKLELGKLSGNEKAGKWSMIGAITAVVLRFAVAFAQVQIVDSTYYRGIYYENSGRPSYTELAGKLGMGYKIGYLFLCFAFLVSVVFFLKFWYDMMTDFDKKFKLDKTWIVGWILLPVVPYIYVIATNSDYEFKKKAASTDKEDTIVIEKVEEVEKEEEIDAEEKVKQ